MIEYIISNWIILSIGFFCGGFAGFFMELEEECARNTWTKYKQYLNTNLSWRNKWEWYGDKRIPIINKRWWYLWIWTPEYEPKFLYSSTALVFITDGEHLFQFFRNRFITFIGFVIGWQLFLAIQLGIWVMSAVKELIKWIK
jgi:hypothetical protein